MTRTPTPSGAHAAHSGPRESYRVLEHRAPTHELGAGARLLSTTQTFSAAVSLAQAAAMRHGSRTLTFAVHLGGRELARFGGDGVRCRADGTPLPEAPLVAGGQGRAAAEVVEAAGRGAGAALLALVVVALALVLGGVS